MLEDLRREVLEANLEIARLGLALYTWGNASGADRGHGIVAIKPSGVPYDELTTESIVLLDIEGNKVEGDLAPSTDAPSHLVLYRAWPDVGGVAHTHSPAASAWAQGCCELPCFGTTHADHFYGPVPVTEPLTDEEIASGYEVATGESIVRVFEGGGEEGDPPAVGTTTLSARPGIDPLAVPGVLCANHGPFTWGKTPARAVYHGAVLEECAKMAMWTLAVAPDTPPLRKALLDKHYLRKHGEGAYYGQPKGAK